MTTYLLDVNVSIALADPAHVQHEPSHEWFRCVGKHSFATCPITEDSLLRVVSHPRYPDPPGMPAAVAGTFASLRSMAGHHFWPDEVGLMDAKRIDLARPLGHSQATDSDLLALARAHGRRLASLERKLIVDAAKVGATALQLI